MHHNARAFSKNILASIGQTFFLQFGILISKIPTPLEWMPTPLEWEKVKKKKEKEFWYLKLFRQIHCRPQISLYDKIPFPLYWWHSVSLPPQKSRTVDRDRRWAHGRGRNQVKEPPPFSPCDRPLPLLPLGRLRWSQV
jgi:hypothetical protein